jgi:hypothetical protein
MTTCATVHPVIMTEWGFTTTSETLLNGTITGYGQPLMDFIEGLGIGNTAWVASYDWGPPMFWRDWTLRCDEGEMGCFVKDTLYLRRNDGQPYEQPLIDFNGDRVVDINDLVILIEYWKMDEPLCDIAPPPFGDSIVDRLDLELFISYLEQENKPEITEAME